VAVYAVLRHGGHTASGKPAGRRDGGQDD
jgi:FSR family fosmidomycin resistance protein-like MFS transporter